MPPRAGRMHSGIVPVLASSLGLHERDLKPELASHRLQLSMPEQWQRKRHGREAGHELIAF
eukprot:1153961-Pelagomonas_calceolata.AAC.10